MSVGAPRRDDGRNNNSLVTLAAQFDANAFEGYTAWSFCTVCNRCCGRGPVEYMAGQFGTRALQDADEFASFVGGVRFVADQVEGHFDIVASSA